MSYICEMAVLMAFRARFYQMQRDDPQAEPCRREQERSSDAEGVDCGLRSNNGSRACRLEVTTRS